MLVKEYGIDWYDTHGEVKLAHPSIVAKIAEHITRGDLTPFFLDSHRGNIQLAYEKSDKTFCNIEVIRAEDPQPTDEELAHLDFPVLRIAMPRGKFKIYYPKSWQENMPWEGRHWDEGSSDCYRLALDYYRKELGIEIREVTTPKNYTLQMMTYAKTNLFMENFASSGMEQVLIPEPGDAILFQSGLATFDGPDHVGIYLEGDKLLHHYRNRLSTVQDYTNMWRQKAVMVLRHTSRM